MDAFCHAESARNQAKLVRFFGISASFAREVGTGILRGFLGKGGIHLCQIRVNNVTEVNFFLTFRALVFKVSPNRGMNYPGKMTPQRHGIDAVFF